ncbi:MAG: prepilin-type N-terminal cleavage/methylation domain-containing protein [Vicinamibacterales bacterium]
MIRTRADGFSLIELMIVAGLIAVLASATAPSIAAGLRRYSLITASQEVVSTIRSARHQAVGRNAILRVRFDHPAVGQYQVLDAADAAIGDVRFLPEGANFSAVSGDIQITTSGRVTDLAGNPTTETIVVSNVDGQSTTITVSASGRVQLP